MGYRCPGLANRIPAAKAVPRPSCGESVEVFSDERSDRCPSCRQIVAQDPWVSCRTGCSGCEGTPSTGSDLASATG